ncbi:MAG: pantoate--beta-alanine ligase [Nitrospirota bacterium]|nr:MAG: pantoate--beta-alanine ligase [Nitrospirota bacterium]
MIDRIASVPDMASRSKGLSQNGKSIGFVPTMGALHEGHLSLVRRSVSENDVTVVSIFINPTQFAPSEDLDKYPRDIDGDLEKLDSVGSVIAFIPSIDEIYPEGYRTYVNVEGITEVMCGEFRPGHFKGVTTVVAKLFNIVRPDRAYFGQKDFQQAVVIRKMAADLDTGIDIVLCPTVREEDGLAMSSRNQYLSSEERKAASVIYRSMFETSEMLRSGSLMAGDARGYLVKKLRANKMVGEVQYASIYDPVTFEEIRGEGAEEMLIAVALYIGGTRLIDNMLLKLG